MAGYRVRVVVKEVKGTAPWARSPETGFAIERFYVLDQGNAKICLHALMGMSSLLMPFLKGVSARELGLRPRSALGVETASVRGAGAPGAEPAGT